MKKKKKLEQDIARHEKNHATPHNKNEEENRMEAMVEEGLMEIYKEGDDLPDMSKIERKPRSLFKKILITSFVTLLILAAVTWAGFFVFQNTRPVPKKNVTFSVKAPQTLASGEEITYTIRVENMGRNPLSRLNVTVRYPDGFIFEEAFPAPLDEAKTSWALGTLSGTDSEEVEIRGRLLGNVNTEKTLNAFLDYRPANFNADFEEVASTTTKLASSAIEVSLKHDDFMVAGEKSGLEFTIRNTETKPFPKTRITLLSSEAFTLNEATPKSEAGDGMVWILNTLESNKDTSLALKGTWSEASGTKETLTLKIESSGNEGVWLLQQEKTFLLDILKGELLTNLIVNGSRENQPVKLGDTLSYSLLFANKGDTDMKNLVVKATIKGNAVLWDTLSDSKKGVVKDGVITWTSKELPLLKTLAPNEEGTIDFQIKIKAPEDIKTASTLDEKIESSFAVEIGGVGASATKTTVKSPVITHTLNSDTSLNAGGRYYNDDNVAVGTGPVPPEVGKTTGYRVYWTLKNSLHELTNITIKSVLPSNVFWTGKSLVGAGQLNFNVSTREIVWTLNKMPTNIKELETNFEISITPSPADSNTVLTLLPETTIEAMDSVTKEKIFLLSGAITSNLEGDPVAEGRGLVK